MATSDLLNHLLNFAAPAAFVAVLVMLLARVLVRRVPRATAWWVQLLLNFAVGLAVLVGGLWVYGVDGKMVTYAVLVLACASSQWIAAKAWR